MKITIENGIPHISPDELVKTTGVRIIDVRRKEEFTGELGHIAKAELVTLGPELTKFLNGLSVDTELVFVCRSGARSASATQESLKLGFKQIANLSGGMIRWNAERFPVEK